MEVKLAGYNVDTEVIEKLKTRGWDRKNNITPETISAAYARISRDPRSVNELRADSRDEVDKARKSNENIVFKMGHHSVAEHAMLNFDILGLSRLAAEALEEARLCSYTEKSQRYITLEGDYVSPSEFDENEKSIFASMVDKQVQAYKSLFPILFEYQTTIHRDMLDSKTGLNTIEGWAKEDARYVLPMAMECQLGFSANARNIETLIRKFKYHPLPEVQELGHKLYENAKTVVPSLIILSDPEAFKKQFGFDVSDGILTAGRKYLRELAGEVLNMGSKDEASGIKLLYHTADPDAAIIAALLHSVSDKPYSVCFSKAKSMKKKGQKKFLQALLKDLSEHDSLFREFETAGFMFEAVVSSSAFAQIKRHRMMTLIRQNYDISLGFTVPPSIIETGQQELFNGIMNDTERIYKQLCENHKDGAEYILTNAHRRRILIGANLREIYHISRLRMDTHAQWDIRNISEKLVTIVKKAAPVTAGLLCGKDVFNQTKDDFLQA